MTNNDNGTFQCAPSRYIIFLSFMTQRKCRDPRDPLWSIHVQLHINVVYCITCSYWRLKRQLLNSLRWPINLINPATINKSPYKFVCRELVPRVLFVPDDGRKKMSHFTWERCSIHQLSGNKFPRRFPHRSNKNDEWLLKEIKQRSIPCS